VNNKTHQKHYNIFSKQHNVKYSIAFHGDIAKFKIQSKVMIVR